MTAAQKREVWLAERSTYIGASEVAGVLGVSAYDSPHSVWLAKTKGVQKEETYAMRKGTHMEALIAQEWTRTTGIRVTRSKLKRHSKWPFMACNPDRVGKINGTPFLLEIKHAGHWAGQQFGTDGADMVPEHYMVQVAYQMIVTGIKLACLFADIDGDLRAFWYTFDEKLHPKAHLLDIELAKSITKRVCEFWETHIVQGVEPELSHAETDEVWVKGERATYDNGLLTNTDERTDAECQKHRRAAVRLKRAQKVEAERKNRIRHFMAQRGASALESTIGIYTWNTNVKGVASFKTPYKSGQA